MLSFSRLTGWCALLALPLTTSLAAPVAVPPPVATQASDGGWTFRITQSGFLPGDTDFNRRNPDRPLRQAPSFVAFFEAESAGGEQARWSSNLRAHIFSPQNVPVSTQIKGSSVVSEAVNPAWPFVWIEFWGRDPFAPDGLSPAEANGEIIQKWTLELPKPTINQELVVDKTFTSDLGATLKIEKLVWQEKDGGNQLNGTYSWTRPADAPEAILQGQSRGLSDEAGKPRSNGGGGGGGQDGGNFSIVFQKPPTTDIWYLPFGLTQKLASRATVAHRFKVRLKVPLSSTKVVAPDDAQTSKAAAFASDGVEGRLENNGLFVGPQWTGRIWTRDTKDAGLFWTPKNIEFSLPDGTKFPGYSFGQPAQLFFHRDGSRAQNGEWMQQIMATMPASNPRPATLNAEVELEARRALDSDFVVKATIPKLGETLKFDEDAQTQNGAAFTLIAARYYRDPSEVPGARANEIPARGVALVFRATPLAPNPAVFYALMDGQRGFVRDDQNRPLDGLLQMRWQDSNALEARSSARGYFSAFITAPAPDAKQIEIAGFLHEESAPLKTVKVKIEGVPVVPKPQSQN